MLLKKTISHQYYHQKIRKIILNSVVWLIDESLFGFRKFRLPFSFLKNFQLAQQHLINKTYF